MAILLITVFIITAFIIGDAVPMYLNKEWKQFWVYTVMMFGILVLVFLKQIMNIHIPSPAGPMKDVLVFIFGKK